MKRILLLILIFIIFSIPIYAEQEIFKLVIAKYSIEVNGKQMTSELPILNYNGNTYIPLKKVSEALGSTVTWDKTNNKVKITGNGYDTPMPLENNTINSNLLLSAPEEVDFENNSYSFKADILRNGMPNQSLLKSMLDNGVTIYVFENEGITFSEKIDVDKIWIVSSGKVWDINYLGEKILINQNNKMVLKKHSPCFPAFAAGSEVDVIIRLVGENGDSCLLRVSNQKVTESW